MELERRWELNSLEDVPKDNIQNILHIEQVYANLNPDVRIRSTKDKNNNSTEYSHCVKYFISSNVREEIEQDITKEQYNRIFNYINKKPVIKNRYLVNINNGYIAEVDKFLDVDKTIVEVEFTNEDDMKNFIPPNWFGKEIKDKRSYSKTIFEVVNTKSDFDLLYMKYSN